MTNHTTLNNVSTINLIDELADKITDLSGARQEDLSEAISLYIQHQIDESISTIDEHSEYLTLIQVERIKSLFPVWVAR